MSQECPGCGNPDVATGYNAPGVPGTHGDDLKGGETETLGFSINFIDSVAVGSRPFEWDGRDVYFV